MPAISILVIAILAAYVVGIFVLNALRKRKGKPSLFVDSCSHLSGRGLVRAYRKKYGKKAKDAQ